MTPSPIRIAIAGFGYSARVFHLPFLVQDARFTITKVFERSGDKAQAALPQAQTVRTFAELLADDVDLILNTTPNQTHFDMAKQALEAGKHVVVEKPLATTSAEARTLAALAAQHNVLLSVYQNRRWDSPIATAKQILAQDLLGEIVDAEIRIERYAKTKNVKAWKETGERGTGLVYDLGVHLLDQAVYLFGKPAKLFADIRSQHADSVVDDNFNITLYYDSGLRVLLSASKYAREAGKYFVMHGKLGSYSKANSDQQEPRLAQGVIPQGDWNSEAESEWGILHTELNGEVVRRPYPNAHAGYQDYYDNLYAAVRQGAPLNVTAEQAAYVLSLIEKAFASAQAGRVVAV